VVFFHQLYDDCGNQPAGTDFPFNPGFDGVCPLGQFCAGDAFGLFRNGRGAVCFSQHPEPDTARPAATAYRLIADLFGEGAFARPQVDDTDDEIIIFTFEAQRPGKRIRVLWNRTFEPVVFETDLVSPAKLYSIDTVTTAQPDAEGVYRFTLPPAQPDYYPFLEPGDASAVGGAPYLLVESTRQSASALPLPTVYAPLP
jgi:hypothetical protein